MLSSVSIRYPRVPTDLTRVRSILKSSSDAELSSFFLERQTLTKFITFAPVAQCNEDSGMQFVEKMCATTPNPLRAEIDKLEKIKLFTASCYKVWSRTTYYRRRG